MGTCRSKFEPHTPLRCRLQNLSKSGLSHTIGWFELPHPGLRADHSHDLFSLLLPTLPLPQDHAVILPAADTLFVSACSCSFVEVLFFHLSQHVNESQRREYSLLFPNSLSSRRLYPPRGSCPSPCTPPLPTPHTHTSALLPFFPPPLLLLPLTWVFKSVT